MNKEFLEKIKPVVKETVETIVFVVVMVVIIRFFIGEIRWIPSGSMRPTLVEGDRVFIERFSRFVESPNRGDIMVFYPPFVKLNNTPLGIFQRLTGFFCKDIAYIKRVVGIPGDKFELKKFTDGAYKVYINDIPYEEDYIYSEYDYLDCNERMFCGPFRIPQGQYFMMGDNRGNSQDSRFWGFLPEDRFVGKAVFLMRFWPLFPLNRIKFSILH